MGSRFTEKNAAQIWERRKTSKNSAMELSVVASGIASNDSRTNLQSNTEVLEVEGDEAIKNTQPDDFD